MLCAFAAAPCLAQSPDNAATGPIVSIDIDHMSFTPSEITIAPGTTVTWINKEIMPHNVVDQNKGFRSKILNKDAMFSFTFTAAGDYDYICQIHPNMKGKVIVKPGAG